MKSAIIISIIVLLVGGVFGNLLRYHEQIPDSSPDFSLIPYEKSGFLGVERRFDPQSYDVLKADTTTLRLYHSSDVTGIWLFISYFKSQKYGSQIHSPKHCLPGGGWRIEKLEEFDLPLPDGTTKNINRLTITEGKRVELMFYWFETRGGSLTDEFAVKWDLAANSLAFIPTDAAFVRLNIPVQNGDINRTTELAVEFFNIFFDDIEKALPFGK